MRFILAAYLLFSTLSYASEECKVFFSPTDRLCLQLVGYIDGESESLKIAIFNLTHREVKEALIRAKNRGVDVQVVIDEGYTQHPTLVQNLIKEKIAVFVYNVEAKKRMRPLMHHKFCLFGKQKVVWTGSFNFTYKADKDNRENAIVLGEDQAYQRFVSEFEDLVKNSKKL